MTTATLNKYRKFTYNEAGKPVSVELDLRNKSMRIFFEEMMEDYEDTLAVIEAKKNDNGERYLYDVETKEFILISPKL